MNKNVIGLVGMALGVVVIITVEICDVIKSNRENGCI